MDLQTKKAVNLGNKKLRACGLIYIISPERFCFLDPLPFIISKNKNAIQSNSVFFIYFSINN